jgi:hypothetical protein
VIRSSIRPDVHVRFQALVARADAKVKSEQQPLRKRSTRLLDREAPDRAGVGRDDNDAA